jgi:hypothetical protein
MLESTEQLREKMIQNGQRNAAAISRALRQAAIEHALLGRSIPASVMGKVVWVSPEEVLTKLGEERQTQVLQRNGT